MSEENIEFSVRFKTAEARVWYGRITPGRKAINAITAVLFVLTTLWIIYG